MTKKEVLTLLKQAEAELRNGHGTAATSSIKAAKAGVATLREPAPPVTTLFRSPGLLSDMDLGGAGDVSALVQGDGYIESHLTGNGYRAEYAYEGVEVRDGETVTDNFEFFIVPDHMRYGHWGAHNLFMQFKSSGEGSPLFGLGLWDEGPGRKGVWTTGNGDVFRCPAAEGQWHSVSLQITGSERGQGSWSLSVDGRLVGAATGVTTIVTGRGHAYIKHGLYRNADEGEPRSIPGDGWILQRGFWVTR